MAGVTNHLGLSLLGVSAEDKGITFEDWRSTINGETSSSNMNLIDAAIGEDRTRISEVEADLETMFSSMGNLLPLSGSTDVPTGTDLNTLNIPGVYSAVSEEIATSLENSPTIHPFKMVVMEAYTPTSVAQWLSTSSNEMYIRQFVGEAWSSWVCVYTTDNKPTYEDVGAAAAEHTHNEYAEKEHTHSEYASSNHSHMYSDVGAAASTHTHTEYADASHTHTYPVTSVAGKTGAVTLTAENVGIVYSSTQPTGSAGKIWLKPIK